MSAMVLFGGGQVSDGQISGRGEGKCTVKRSEVLVRCPAVMMMRRETPHASFAASH